ncbi:hypothetical protein [Pseudomonas sp. TWP3-1]|uniref:hypothetical protein n=1 Tax=Pseudomonas sp. TWP3-1 TaxID=2804631 RepID=UPI003CF9B52C
MILRTILISLSCFASFIAHAAELPIKEGMSFTSARKALIKSGWQPNRTYSGEFGVENILMREGLVEIESCTEGVRFCSFNYKKKDICLGVGTVGEKIKDMKIYSWNFECPETQ